MDIFRGEKMFSWGSLLCEEDEKVIKEEYCSIIIMQ